MSGDKINRHFNRRVLPSPRSTVDATKTFHRMHRDRMPSARSWKIVVPMALIGLFTFFGNASAQDSKLAGNLSGSTPKSGEVRKGPEKEPGSEITSFELNSKNKFIILNHSKYYDASKILDSLGATSFEGAKTKLLSFDEKNVALVIYGMPSSRGFIVLTLQNGDVFAHYVGSKNLAAKAITSSFGTLSNGSSFIFTTNNELLTFVNLNGKYLIKLNRLNLITQEQASTLSENAKFQIIKNSKYGELIEVSEKDLWTKKYLTTIKPDGSSATASVDSGI